jgi:D-glycerate 3-kinase
MDRRILDRLTPTEQDAWGRAARRLEADLRGAPELDRRIHHFYLPVLFFALAERRRIPSRPVFIGIQAPQGAGKTTLVQHLLELLPDFGLRGVGLSIDDFYLTRAEQLAVAAAHPGNPYLEHRGYPGTHDVDLGVRTLDALRELNAGTVRVPRYDKSAHGGRGDRAPESAWTEVQGSPDLVFLDGWMLGFEPVAETRLPDPRLIPANRALASYGAWLDRLDAFVVLRAKDTNYVVNWRIQAEEAAKAQGRPGLSREAIEDYVRRFLPAYETYGAVAPRRFGDRTLEIVLDEERRPASAR